MDYYDSSYNSSQINSTYLDYHNQPHHPFAIFQVGFMVLLNLVSLGGHGIIIFLVLSRSSLRSVPNLYILNISIADLLIALMSPFQFITFFSQQFFFGDIGCKVIAYFTQALMLINNALLVVLCIDCYLACRNHKKDKGFRSKLLKIISGVVWIGCMIICVPVALQSEFYEDHGFFNCLEGGLFHLVAPLTWIVSWLIMVVLPFVLIWVYISLMYPPKNAQNGELDLKTKGYRFLVFVLVITFNIFQLPHCLGHVVYYAGWFYSEILFYVFIVFFDINTAGNAVICLYLSQDLKSIVLSWLRKKPIQPSPSEELVPI